MSEWGLPSGGIQSSSGARPGGRAGKEGLEVPFLLPSALRPAAGMAEPATTIDGQTLSVSNLEEEESRVFTCVSAAPNLAWYLNGERQESNGSSRPVAPAAEGRAFEGGSSTFAVTARRLYRHLNCSAVDPSTGSVSSASVLLNVLCEPPPTAGSREGRGRGWDAAGQRVAPCFSPPLGAGASPPQASRATIYCRPYIPSALIM